MKKEKCKGSILLPALICTLLWGSAFPSVKSGYALFGIGDEPFSKLFFAGWRFMLAGVLVLAVYIILYRKPFLPNRSMWKGILILGLVQTTLQYVFFYIGLSHTTGVKGSVLTATTTFLAVLISHFVFPNDRLNRYKVVGCILGFEGVILISMGSGSLFAGGFAWNGEGFMILSAAAAAVGAVISKIVARGAEPMVITGWQLFFGGAILLVSGTAGGGHFSSTPPQAFVLLGYLIFLSATAFTVWTMLLKKHPVGKVTVYNFLVPVFGSLMSGIVLGEDVFTGRNIASLLLVCAGIILVNLRLGAQQDKALEQAEAAEAEPKETAEESNDFAPSEEAAQEEKDTDPSESLQDTDESEKPEETDANEQLSGEEQPEKLEHAENEAIE